MKLYANFSTHKGLVRRGNEDSYLLMPEAGIFVVADGMGGHAHGEIASKIAVDTIQGLLGNQAAREALKHDFDQLKSQGSLVHDFPIERYMLRVATERANLAIFEKAQESKVLESMGTTIVALHQGEDSQGAICNVGDSRIYRLRNRILTQLTDDHSLLNEYLKLNLVSQEDARNFPLKNIIVRALGLSDWVEVDTVTVDFRVGDRFLLCSDGLTDLVGDDVIEEIMGRWELERIPDVLTNYALAAGGSDNITAMVVEVRDS